MISRTKYSLTILAILFCSSILFAQKKSVSDLLILLKQDKEDVNKVNHLNALAQELMSSNPDTAIIIGTQEIEIIGALYNVPGPELEEEIRTNQSLDAKILKRLFTNAFSNLGICYRIKADYPNALLYFKKGLVFSEELEDKNGIAKSLGHIGVCFRLKGDYPQALEYLLKALKLDEELGNKPGTAARLGGIGSVYWNQSDYTKALTYYSKALKLNEELGDKNGIASNLGNMGSVFYQQSDLYKDNPAQRKQSFERALEYYLKALKIAEEAGSKQLQSNTLGNIGAVYKDKGDYAGALTCHLKAMKIAEELGDKNSQATQLGSIGSLYMQSPSMPSLEGEEKKGFALAEKYLHRALDVSQSIGAMDNVKNWYEQLSTLYEKSNVPLPDTIENKLLTIEQTHLRAIYYMKCYISVRDTLFSDERKKQLKKEEMAFAIDKKEAEVKAEQEEKLAHAQAEKRQQQIIIFIMSCVLIIVLVFAVFIFRSLKAARKLKDAPEKEIKF